MNLSGLPTRFEISQERAKRSTLGFAKHFFKEREGMDFIDGPHHQVVGHTLDRVYALQIPRLLITLPPGYTKTEMAVVNFIARGFYVNPRARFIHTTYSDELASENSAKVKTLIELPDFQDLETVTISNDTSAKDRWKTDQGGGVLAKAAGGSITGFRAGYMDKDVFSGALVVDDPLKPDDAFSVSKRAAVNRRATNTFRSRLAHENIPIVVIMQRLHDDDFAGHLLKGGSGDIWDHLDLQAVIDHSSEYPKEWTHGRPIEHNLPEGPLWPEKQDEAELEIIKADAYTYASQYMQRPVSVEGALFDMPSFRWYTESETPAFEYFRMYADTAQKTAERNDFSVIELWGKMVDGGIALVDLVRGKWESPMLEQMARAFWAKHKGKNVRGLLVEDKVSGTGLIQSLKGTIPVEGVQRNRDKFMRGLDAAPWIKTGQVWLPSDRDWTEALRYELQTFDGMGTGFDDQVDPLMDAIADMLGNYGPPTPKIFIRKKR